MCCSFIMHLSVLSDMCQPDFTKSIRIATELPPPFKYRTGQSQLIFLSSSQIFCKRLYPKRIILPTTLHSYFLCHAHKPLGNFEIISYGSLFFINN
jgi:hypothetical protein